MTFTSMCVVYFDHIHPIRLFSPSHSSPTPSLTYNFRVLVIAPIPMSLGHLKFYLGFLLNTHHHHVQRYLHFGAMSYTYLVGQRSLK